MCATSTRLIAALVVIGLTAACGGDDDDGGPDGSGEPDAASGGSWTIEQQDLPGALLSVWGSTAEGVWAVGSRTGSGPLVLHGDGAGWGPPEDASSLGEIDLWWVFGLEDGPVYLGGSGGTIAAYQDGVFTPMTTPTTGVTVFGIWGCSPDDVWAVGGQEGGSSGFAWRLEDGAWVEAAGFPAEATETGAVWKVFGRGCDDVWMVGTAGLALHWDGKAFGEVELVADNSLFTVHANAERFAAVGGLATGIVVENDGSGWRNVSPSSGEPAVGVCLTDAGGFASGRYGSILVRGDDGWTSESTGIALDQTLHSIWVDPEGDVWAAGGQILSPPYGDGVLLRRTSR